MTKQYKVRFNEFFLDGNVLPDMYKPGQETVLDEVKLAQVEQSGGVGVLDNLGLFIPPSSVAKPKPAPKEVEPEEAE